MEKTKRLIDIYGKHWAEAIPTIPTHTNNHGSSAEVRNDAAPRPQLAPVRALATGRSGCRWCPASPLGAESGHEAGGEKARVSPGFLALLGITVHSFKRFN